MQRNEETLVTDDAAAQSTGKQTSGEDTQTISENPMDTSASGQKHAHESASSKFDKDIVVFQQPEEAVCNQLIVAAPKKGVWTEVKSRKKGGKKGRIEEYYNP